ncbi:unnamed protein product [Psylliodes chrysocephalus]|uniref:Uncharacterized protein n=1 Tax=Psylliodes chrysocephalus TaxID=3402493 RepID=A0A9P0D1R9_9CUCU|nr:unnamed protein product [Psylliodes chrysocephala]
MRILLKLETLKNWINEVENENKVLKDRIENLEKTSKKNNFILFGVNTSSSDRSISVFCEVIKDKLGVPIAEENVSDLYSLGKSIGAPLKIEFVSVIKKSKSYKTVIN